MRMILMAVAVVLIGGCGDPGANQAPAPLRYNSTLSADHAVAFERAANIWEAVTGINLFDAMGRDVSVGYGHVAEPNLAWTFDSGDIIFESDFQFAEYCSGDKPFGSFALHELGHAIGLVHVNDPSSIMYVPIRGCLLPSERDIETVRSIWE